LAAGQSATYTLTLRATRSGHVVLPVQTFSLRTVDPDQSNNRASVRVTLS
jgi:hypothetical protein